MSRVCLGFGCLGLHPRLAAAQPQEELRPWWEAVGGTGGAVQDSPGVTRDV